MTDDSPLDDDEMAAAAALQMQTEAFSDPVSVPVDTDENTGRWTIDEDGWIIAPSHKAAIASWDHEQAVDADMRLRPDDFAALVALVRAATAPPTHTAKRIRAWLAEHHPDRDWWALDAEEIELVRDAVAALTSKETDQ